MPKVTPRKVRDHRVVGLERAREIRRGSSPRCAHLRRAKARRHRQCSPAHRYGRSGSRPRPGSRSIWRSIATTSATKSSRSVVDGGRGLVVEALADAVGPDQRHLGRLLRHACRRMVFLEWHVARELEPRLGRPAMRRPRCRVMQSGMSQRCSGGAALDASLVGFERRALGVVALDRGAETVLEIKPAHLAVADHVEADALLQAHRARAPPHPRSR